MFYQTVKKSLKKKNIKDVQLVYVQSVENKMIPISITASGSILARDRMEIYTKNFNEKVQAGLSFWGRTL